MIARNTALTYKGKPVDAKAIGRELGVRYVLEGSVQPSGNQVRVNAQLIDAESGAHLWADQFDMPRADLLQTQDKIVARLARAMYLQLPEVEAARLKRTPAANPDAEDLALQCQAAMLKNGFIGKSAFPACERALAADPDNVRALTWSAIKFLPSLGRGDDPGDDLKAGRRIVVESLALDPKYAPLTSLKLSYCSPSFASTKRSPRTTRVDAGSEPRGRLSAHGLRNESPGESETSLKGRQGDSAQST